MPRHPDRPSRVALAVLNCGRPVHRHGHHHLLVHRRAGPRRARDGLGDVVPLPQCRLAVLAVPGRPAPLEGFAAEPHEYPCHLAGLSREFALGRHPCLLPRLLGARYRPLPAKRLGRHLGAGRLGICRRSRRRLRRRAALSHAKPPSRPLWRPLQHRPRRALLPALRLEAILRAGDRVIRIGFRGRARARRARRHDGISLHRGHLVERELARKPRFGDRDVRRVG
mmetsp:Transcript_107331/g.308883  ORF Transcript_107331/g.308883 Transcript_107331/m.308883 type:complete len:225 (+) Transcript_107331:733-1407(+)